MIQSLQASIPRRLHRERFDLVAVTLFPTLSRKHIKKIIDAGGAYLNKRRISFAKHAVQENDLIEVFWQQESAHKNEPGLHIASASTCSRLTTEHILYEHPRFLVLNKPAGLASQPTQTSQQQTVTAFLERLDNKKFPANRLFLVHRLDKDTSGLMLIARDKQTQDQFQDLFQKRLVKKEYDALCLNIPKDPEGTINFAISKDPARYNTYLAVTNNRGKSHSAKEAQTQYKIQRIYQKTIGPVCHLRCTPLTGRTHQIRVHLAAVGCAIVGDKTYGQSSVTVGHPWARLALRHMLHASHISFSLYGENYQFDAPLAADFVEAVRTLES